MKSLLASGITLLLLVLASDARASSLRLEIFVAEPEEFNVTSVLITGQTEMMVVCAQAKRSSAMRLADLIASKGLDLEYVFLTHPHLLRFTRWSPAMPCTSTPT